MKYSAIYSSTVEQNLKNSFESDFFIYKTEIANTGGQYYLKVFIHNRKKDGGQPKKISFSFEDEKQLYETTKFNIVSEFNDPNVFGTVIKIDQTKINSGNTIKIVEYIAASDLPISLSKWQLIKEPKTISNDYSNRIRKLEPQYNIYPTIHQDHWYCLCGCVNNTSVCVSCGRDKEQQQFYSNLDPAQLILTFFLDKFRVIYNFEYDFDSNFYDSLKSISDTEGISSHIENIKENRKKEFLLNLNDYIQEKKKSNPINPKTKGTIDEIINDYCIKIKVNQTFRDILFSNDEINELVKQNKEYTDSVKKSNKLRTLIVSSVVVLVTLISLLYQFYFAPLSKYNLANEYINKGQYMTAYELLTSLGNFRNSKELALEADFQYKYSQAYSKFQEGLYLESLNLLQPIIDNEKSQDLYYEIHYVLYTCFVDPECERRDYITFDEVIIELRKSPKYKDDFSTPDIDKFISTYNEYTKIVDELGVLGNYRPRIVGEVSKETVIPYVLKFNQNKAALLGFIPKFQTINFPEKEKLISHLMNMKENPMFGTFYIVASYNADAKRWDYDWVSDPKKSGIWFFMLPSIHGYKTSEIPVYFPGLRYDFKYVDGLLVVSYKS